MVPPFHDPKPARATVAGIIGLTIFSALAALLLAMRGDLRLTIAMAILLWLMLLIAVAHHVWFLAIPTRLTRVMNRGTGPWARRLFGWIIATPSLLGGRWKLPARYQLITLDLVRRRYEEAEEQCRAMLAYRLTPGVEGNVRKSLADCLERLGRTEEAAEERTQPAARLAGPAADYMGSLARGKILEDRGAFDEAFEAYETGLALAPAKGEMRTILMLRMAIAAHTGGRTRDAARWAEQALSQHPSEVNERTALEIAAPANTNLGRWDKAESQLTRLYGLRERRGGAGNLARAIAMQADLKFARGDLAGAYKATMEADAIDPAERHPMLIRANILVIEGRHEEALAQLARARAATPAKYPAQERRLQAIMALTMARVAAEFTRPDEARGFLGEAVPVIGHDPRLAPTSEATAAWIHALLREREQAEHHLQAAEERLADFGDDDAPMTPLATMGMAALALGYPARALGFWEQFLERGPRPYMRPAAHYHIGECRRLLGHLHTARRAYHEATQAGVETDYARKAAERLHALPLGTGDPF
jgi:tetratricopeptide (TPR) repeat protein